jgi:hypothetical protein
MATDGNATLGDDTSFKAEAGNVSILAAGNIFGAASGTNTFFARGKDTKTGGVEILSGTTASLIGPVITSRPAPPDENITVSGVDVITITPGGDVRGLIEVQGSGLGTVSLAGTATINTFNGAVLINGVGVSSVVQLNDASVTSIIPIGYTREQSPVTEESIVDTGEIDNDFLVDTVDYFAEANVR